LALAGWSTYVEAASTSTGSQALSTPVSGQTIRGCVIEVTRGVTLNAIVDHAVLGAGICDGSNVFSFSSRAEDNVNPTDTGRRFSRNIVELSNAANNNADGVAAFTSFGTNIVNINWTTAPAAAYLLVTTVFWGDLMECEASVQVSSSTLNGDVVVSSLGIDPRMLLVWGHDGPFTATPGSGDNARFYHGCAVYNETDDAIEQVCCHYHDRDNNGLASAVGNTFRDDSILQSSTISAAGVATFNQRVAVQSFGAGGWTMRTLDVAASMAAMFLAVRPGANRLALSAQNIETATAGTGAAKKITTGWQVGAARSFASGFNRL